MAGSALPTVTDQRLMESEQSSVKIMAKVGVMKSVCVMMVGIGIWGYTRTVQRIDGKLGNALLLHNC